MQVELSFVHERKRIHAPKTATQRGSLILWFDAEMGWEAKLSGRPGRQQADSALAIQACRTLKVLFALPLWQA